MRLLILGGTADGRLMAEHLHARMNSGGFNRDAIVYSVAGLVRVPQVPCEVISGGFTQYGGLTQYIRAHSIDALLDMTHPYAQRMSQTAKDAAAETGIACWRFHRPAWEAAEGDNWHECVDWPQLLSQLQDKKSILFTAGQMEKEVLRLLVSMSANSDKSYVLRTAIAPQYALPPNMQWIKAIGPFSEHSETELMRKFEIDVLVSKNSGGDSTSAKLTVARNLGIPVYMLSRPDPVFVDHVFSDFDLCEDFVINSFSDAQATPVESVQSRIESSCAKRGSV